MYNEMGKAIRSQSTLIFRQVGLDSRGAAFQTIENLIALGFGRAGLNIDLPEFFQALLSCIPQRSQRIAEFAVAMAGDTWGRIGVVVTIGRRIRPIDIIVGNRLTATTTKPVFHIDFRERAWKRILVITIAPSSVLKRNVLRLGESAATPVLNRKAPTQCSTGTHLDAPHRRDTARLPTDADSTGHSGTGRGRAHSKCGPAPALDHVQGLIGVAGAFRCRCQRTAVMPLRIWCASRLRCRF